MSFGNFKIGDLVWATMKMYPTWPGRIASPPENAKEKPGKHYVFFFGSNNFAWISNKNIRHHSEELIPPNYKKRKYPLFKDAVEAIKHFSLNEDSEDSQDIAIIEESSSVIAEEKPSEKVTENIAKKRTKSKGKKQVNLRGKKRKNESGDEKVKKQRVKIGNERVLSNFSETAETSESFKNSSCSSDRSEISETPESFRNSFCSETFSNHSEASEDATCSKIVSYGSEPSEKSEDAPCSKSLRVASCSTSHQRLIFNRASNGNSMPRKGTFFLAENRFHERSEIKYIHSKSLKIGFLGLGSIGLGIVKNLIYSGHELVIWNKTAEKCQECVEAGAVRASSPAEVVKASDIIFSCVSDAIAIKTILFGPDGVLKGFEECTIEEDVFKGFVELSSVDYETTQTASAAIISKGGTYLEAPVFGTKQLADTGSLFILASGDLNLFYACETCFNSIAVHSYYLSFVIGECAKYNIALNMFLGTAYGSLLETLNFAKRLGINTDVFFEILNKKGYMSEALIEQGNAFLNRDVSDVNSTLKHVKKVMNLGLNLSDLFIQPVSVSAAANTFFKSSQFLRYMEPDNVTHEDEK